MHTLKAGRLNGKFAFTNRAAKLFCQSQFAELFMALDPLPFFEEVVEFRFTLNAESDRGCALMAAAYLDEQLAALLGSHFVDCQVSMQLVSQNGPLATFSSRIDACFALGLISEKIRRDLNLIRRTRNDFAHTSKPLKFTDPSLADRCRELHHNYRDETAHPRTLFNGVVIAVASAIHCARQATNRAVSPADLDLRKEERTAIKRTMDALTSELPPELAVEFLLELKNSVAELAKKTQNKG